MRIKTNQNKESRLLKNTILLYIMQISGYLFPLLSFPYLTRTLGPERYGVVVFSNSVMVYFSLIIEFGFLLSGTNSCSIEHSNKDGLGRITIGIIQAKAILVLISFFILFFVLKINSKLYQNSLYFILSFIGVALTIFLPDFLFRGIEKMSVITYRVVGSKAVYTLLIFILIKNKDDYNFVPIAIIVSNLFAIILTWWEIIKERMISIKLVSLKVTFYLLKESSTFFLSRFASTFYTSLNTLLLGMVYSSTALGYYGAANTLTSTSRSMMSPIADSIYPYMIKEKNFGLIKKILIIIEPVIVLFSILIWYYADQVIRIVCGSGYQDSVPLFRMMIPLIIITLPTYLFGFPILGALGKVKYANISVIYGALFHVFCIVILYFFGLLSFISLTLLSIVTESIVCGIRVLITFKAFSVIKINKHR